MTKTSEIGLCDNNLQETQDIVIDEMQPVANGQFIERRLGGRPVELKQTDSLDRNVWSLLGVPLDTLTMGETVGYVDRAVRNGDKMWLSTPNLDWLSMGRDDEKFHRSMVQADLSVCDGMPVMLLARMAGIPLRTRVPGSGLFTRLREVKPSFRGARTVFFLGGREGAAPKAIEALAAESGGVVGIGSHNPGFGTIEELSDDATIDTVNAQSPNVLIVSLSAYKGQLWISQNIDKLKANVIAPLGAVVDFTAGTIVRAPKWMQKAGMEWLWRIKEDPSLGKRYWRNFKDLPGMTLRVLAIRHKLSRRNANAPSLKEHVDTHIDAMGQKAVIALGTDVRGAQLTPVRKALRAALAENKDIIIDFTANKAFDLALIGLLQLANERALAGGNGMQLANLDTKSTSILKLNGHHLEIIAGQYIADAAQMDIALSKTA